jgi:aminoglycoside phosphotransferase (APT) family kinase protein
MGDLESGLLDVIAARSGQTGLAFARRPTPLGGGYWAEIFAFELRDPPRGFRGELILRRMPDAVRARRETAVQTAVAELGFPTPRVRAAGGEGEPLALAFSIMDRVAGTTLDETRGLGARVRRIAALGRLLGEAQSRLHALPAASIAARLAQRGVEPAELSLDALLDDLARLVRGTGSRELADALSWVAERRPSGGELGERVLCHGDVHPNNLLVAADGSWALIDWTNARFAHPELDVAFTSELLELRPLHTPPGTGALAGLVLRELARRARAAYTGPLPLDRARLAWYRALYRLQLLARVEAAAAALPDAPFMPATHPYRGMAPRARARLRAAMRP